MFGKLLENSYACMHLYYTSCKHLCNTDVFVSCLFRMGSQGSNMLQSVPRADVMDGCTVCLQEVCIVWSII